MIEKVNNGSLVESKTLPGFTVNAIIAEYLEMLVKTGFYGASATDVARTLIYDSINRMVQSEQLKPPIQHAERHEPKKDAEAQTTP